MQKEDLPSIEDLIQKDLPSIDEFLTEESAGELPSVEDFIESETVELNEETQTIEDLNGRIVFSTVLVNTSSIAINFGQLELAKGIYIVGFDSGTTKQTEKLVIQ